MIGTVVVLGLPISGDNRAHPWPSCRLVSVTDHMPLTVRFPKYIPQPFTDESMNNRRLFSSVVREPILAHFWGSFHQIR